MVWLESVAHLFFYKHNQSLSKILTCNNVNVNLPASVCAWATRHTFVFRPKFIENNLQHI